MMLDLSQRFCCRLRASRLRSAELPFHAIQRSGIENDVPQNTINRIAYTAATMS